MLKDVLPKVINLVENGANILFGDEAMFTSRLKQDRVWWLKGEKRPELIKDKLSFPAVAVVGATNVNGDVVAVEICPKYVGEAVFIKFLETLKD